MFDVSVSIQRHSGQKWRSASRVPVKELGVFKNVGVIYDHYIFEEHLM